MPVRGTSRMKLPCTAAALPIFDPAKTDPRDACRRDNPTLPGGAQYAIFGSSSPTVDGFRRFSLINELTDPEAVRLTSRPA